MKDQDWRYILYALGFLAAFAWVLEVAVYSGAVLNVFDVLSAVLFSFCIFKVVKKRLLNLPAVLSAAFVAAVITKHTALLILNDSGITRLVSVVLSAAVFIVVISLVKPQKRRKEVITPLGKEDKFPIFLDEERKHYLPTLALKSHTEIIGTTGSGKTVFMKNAIMQSIAGGAGTFVFDPKSNFVSHVAYYAQSSGRKSAMNYFDCGNMERSQTYNPLYGSDPDEITSRLGFSLFPDQENTNDYYLGLAKDLISNLTTLLLKEVKTVTFNDYMQVLSREISSFKSLVYLCNRYPEDFASIDIKERWLSKPVPEREKQLSGLISRLSRFTNKKWAPLINVRNPQIVMADVMQKNQIFLFATSALVNLEDSRPLIIMAMEDMMAEVGKRFNKPPSVPFDVYLDEFFNAVYPNFIDVLTKCREAFVRIFCAHQSLSDMKHVSETFRDQVLELTSNKIILRVNEQNTADYLAKQLGTVKSMKNVYSFDSRTNAAAGFTQRPDEEFRFHPNVLKERGQGDAIVKSFYGDKGQKVEIFRVNLAKEKPIPSSFDFTSVVPIRNLHKKPIEALDVSEPQTLTEGGEEASAGTVKQGWESPYSRKKKAFDAMKPSEKDLIARIQKHTDEAVNEGKKGKEGPSDKAGQ